MKKNFGSIILASSLLTIGFNASAQKDSSGIYKTADDFKSKKLSLAINCKTEQHKIKADIFLDAEEIKVKHFDSTYIYKKSEVYGYKSCSGKTIRLVDNKDYEILNPNEPIFIYKYVITTPQAKNTSTATVTYFFTTDAGYPLVELTRDNVKKAFPENHSFHGEIDENFKTDEDLISYDQFHHMYKLNWLLQNSMK